MQVIHNQQLSILPDNIQVHFSNAWIISSTRLFLSSRTSHQINTGESFSHWPVTLCQEFPCSITNGMESFLPAVKWEWASSQAPFYNLLCWAIANIIAIILQEDGKIELGMQEIYWEKILAKIKEEVGKEWAEKAMIGTFWYRHCEGPCPGCGGNSPIKPSSAFWEELPHPWISMDIDLILD